MYPCRSNVTPDLEALAYKAMGLIGGEIIGTICVQNEGNAVGAAPGLLNFPSGPSLEGLN